MTRDEILNMEAGEKMDVLVAERVMGWHIVSENGYLHWNDADNHFQCGVSIYDFEDAEDFHTLKWHPSESILWAWDVVEKLCDISGCDIVKICKRDPELLRGNWSCNLGMGFEAFGDTAPLAICRAALLSVLNE